MTPARAATLPRSARLQQRADYAAALSAGSARTRRHFTLFARPNGLAYARLGIIASKRVAARAVDRNRAKRLVREVFRRVRQRMGGLDLVVQLRRCPGRNFNLSAAEDLSRLLEDIGTQPSRHA